MLDPLTYHLPVIPCTLVAKPLVFILSLFLTVCEIVDRCHQDEYWLISALIQVIRAMAEHSSRLYMQYSCKQKTDCGTLQRNCTNDV